ncbi:kinase-like domain-containing protein [Xylariaceae sp. FL0255]|nr:kinase-like domain-containing protein [Xylariaceae sp. FL0255]
MAGAQEEDATLYKPGGFHPVYIGDIFDDRYKVINKLGAGGCGTVWLVEDLEADPANMEAYMALKILRADMLTSQLHQEKEIVTHLKTGDNGARGYDCVLQASDDFLHEGPNGMHVCIVMPIAAGSLEDLMKIFGITRLSQHYVKHVARRLLLALDYAHSRDVIHCDIKPDNIFLKIKDHRGVAQYLAQAPIPVQNRNESVYSVVKSCPLADYFLSGNVASDQFDVVLGDFSVATWAVDPPATVIQPLFFRSPEVLIRAEWNTSTDIWNLGAVLYRLACGETMVSEIQNPDGTLNYEEFLTQIAEIFGPFSKRLLDNADDHELVQMLFDNDGKIKGLEEFEGCLLFLNDYLPGVDDANHKSFANFLVFMMKVDPEDRPISQTLLTHAWLH